LLSDLHLVMQWDNRRLYANQLVHRTRSKSRAQLILFLDSLYPHHLYVIFQIEFAAAVICVRILFEFFL
jgi:hypothetical protein